MLQSSQFSSDFTHAVSDRNFPLTASSLNHALTLDWSISSFITSASDPTRSDSTSDEKDALDAAIEDDGRLLMAHVLIGMSRLLSLSADRDGDADHVEAAMKLVEEGFGIVLAA